MCDSFAIYYDSLRSSSSSVTSSTGVSIGDPRTSFWRIGHLTSGCGSKNMTDFSLGVITSIFSYGPKSRNLNIIPRQKYTISSGISNASTFTHENSVRNVDIVATTANIMVNTAQTSRNLRYISLFCMSCVNRLMS